MKAICIKDYSSTNECDIFEGEVFELDNGDSIRKDGYFICDRDSYVFNRFFTIEENVNKNKGNYNSTVSQEEQEVIRNTLSNENKKEDNKMNKKNVMKQVKDLNIDKKLLKSIEGYMVDSSTVRLTPSGLSIDGKVFSNKTNQLLNVKGTELLLDIPVGFCIPTDVKDIKRGDIIYDSEGKALHVSHISKKKSEVTCISPREDRKVVMLPTVDIFKNQTYNKLITPFNYDFGCNPVLNIASVLGIGYMNKDIDSAIDVLLPQTLKLISKVDLSALVNDKRIVFLSPLLILLYKANKDKNMNLESIKEHILNIDTKTKMLIILALVMLLYVSKDKIAEMLMSDKLNNIPLVNRASKPLAKFLISIPSIKSGLFKKASKSFLNVIGLSEKENK